MTEDPTNHYAVVIYQANPCQSWDGSGANVQIGSYTGNAAGLSSTNTWQNMPTIFNTSGFSSDGSPTLGIMKMNPAGKILAVATAGSDGDGEWNEEFLYHFNGAAPVTNFTSFSIPGPAGDEGTSVFSMQWDASNHLYLLCNSWDGVLTLSVYTVTTTSVKLVDTYAINPNANGVNGGMVVRSL